jgi:3'-5' exoribonuclease
MVKLLGRSYVCPNAESLTMAHPVDLPSLAIGERIQEPLLVLAVEHRGGDSPHSILTLGNRSGQLATAPFWSSDQPRIAGIAKGDVVQVIGEVSLYRDRRQLSVTSIRPLPRHAIDWEALLPSVGTVAPYWETLDRWRNDLRAPRLRDTLALFFGDPDFRQCYEQCPASLAGHHAALGGLLKHTAEVAAIARIMARVAGADPELVLAGVLLHDIGKLEAYTWQGPFRFTDAGALVGHVVLGSLMLERRVAAAPRPPCTPFELQLLHHLILSHHGDGTFGAPVRPLTLEAEVLHYADNASARTASMAQALADPEHFAAEDLLSQHAIWQLDRRHAFRGSSDWGRTTPPSSPPGAE